MRSPLSFAPKPTLTGSLVRLRPLTLTDVPAVLNTLADTESMRLTGTHRQFSTAQVAEAISGWADRDDRVDMAVIERSTGAHAGEVVLDHLDTDNQSCGFRIALTQGYTGRGLGTEATALMLGYAFDTVGVHRVELEVYAFNPRARHVYEKAGFVYEGTKRQVLRWKDHWVDAQILAMLADDWAARRARAATEGHAGTPPLTPGSP
jgi:RimJ/RimL family protein N-acetyltransferase